MRLVLIFVCCAIVGCAANRGTLNQGAIAQDSRSAIAAVNSGIRSIETAAALNTEQKTAARDLLGRLAQAIAMTDQVAARAAGATMSEREAAEVQATLAMIYRQLEGIAARPPASLARGGSAVPPESEEALDDLRRLLR